jgi:hypothetical protein
LRPVRLGLRLARALRERHPDEWEADRMLPLLGDRAVHRALLAGEDVDALERRWTQRLAAFRRLRREHLRYE